MQYVGRSRSTTSNMGLDIHLLPHEHVFITNYRVLYGF